MSDRVKLDPIESGLVDLAVARYREQVAQAERERDAVLLPLRDRYATDRLDLSREDDGWYLLTPAAEPADT